MLMTSPRIDTPLIHTANWEKLLSVWSIVVPDRLKHVEATRGTEKRLNDNADNADISDDAAPHLKIS